MCYSGHFSLEQGNALNETQFVIFLLTFKDTIDETGRLFRIKTLSWNNIPIN